MPSRLMLTVFGPNISVGISQSLPLYGLVNRRSGFACIQVGKKRQFQHLYLEKVFVNLRNSLEAAVTQVVKRSGLKIDYAILRAAHKPHDRSAIEAATQLDLRTENLRGLLQVNSIAH